MTSMNGVSERTGRLSNRLTPPLVSLGVVVSEMTERTWRLR